LISVGSSHLKVKENGPRLDPLPVNVFCVVAIS
jgi:hypothetical protein